MAIDYDPVAEQIGMRGYAMDPMLNEFYCTTCRQSYPKHAKGCSHPHADTPDSNDEQLRKIAAELNSRPGALDT